MSWKELLRRAQIGDGDTNWRATIPGWAWDRAIEILHTMERPMTDITSGKVVDENTYDIWFPNSEDGFTTQLRIERKEENE